MGFVLKCGGCGDLGLFMRRSSRAKAEDWIKGGQALIEADKPLNLETLCQVMGRTKGSFYHHFESIGHFTKVLLEDWRQDATLAIMTQVDTIATDRMKALYGLAQNNNHRFERKLRALGWQDASIGKVIEVVDNERETFIFKVLQSEQPLSKNDAAAKARLLISLFIAAQCRDPDRFETYILSAARLII